jgi:hypothetical protein
MNKKAVIGITALALVVTSVLAVTVLSEKLAVQQANEQMSEETGNLDKIFDCSFQIRLHGYQRLEEKDYKYNATRIVAFWTQNISLYNNGIHVIPSGLKWELVVESEGYYFTASGTTETVNPDSTQPLSFSELRVLDLPKGWRESGWVGAKVTYTLTVAGIGTERMEWYL